MLRLSIYSKWIQNNTALYKHTPGKNYSLKLRQLYRLIKCPSLPVLISTMTIAVTQTALHSFAHFSLCLTLCNSFPLAVRNRQQWLPDLHSLTKLLPTLAAPYLTPPFWLYKLQLHQPSFKAST